MMIYPDPDKLDSIGSKYALVIVAAKRARQIKEEARTLVSSKSANPLTIALEELADSQIIPVQAGPPEVLPDALPAPAFIGGFGTPFPEDGEVIDEDLEPLTALMSEDGEPFEDPDAAVPEADRPIAETPDGHQLFEIETPDGPYIAADSDLAVDDEDVIEVADEEAADVEADEEAELE